MTVRELIASLSRLPPDALVVRAGPVFLVPVTRVGTRELVEAPPLGANPRYRAAEPWDRPGDRKPLAVLA